MGYMRHHAIVVTGFSQERVDLAHSRAQQFGNSVSDIVLSPLNGYSSFFIAPDGSKEGWEDSDNGDDNRDEFILWLNAYEDKGYLDWAEMQYGDEGGNDLMLRNSGDND